MSFIRLFFAWLLLVIVLVACSGAGTAEPTATTSLSTQSPISNLQSPIPQSPNLSPSPYNIGNPTLTDIWVDPVNGDDGDTGTTRDSAVATVTEAWNRIPISTELETTGYRLQLVAGQHPNIPTYWESRWGTYPFPIILNAVDGVGTAVIPNPNLFDVRYTYFIGITVNAGEGGDGFHCEQCDHVLLRQMTVNGNATAPRGVQEAIKFNQSSYVYVEQSDIFGAGDNAVDFVGVQYGHFLGNTIHDATDWCMYLKGGSAYFVVHGNEYYDCGTGGFTVGQGTGFEFMVSPWLHYEGYDVKFINNLIHDTEGAGMGVNGGYNVLLAYNTLYHVGERSHVLEVVFGGRGCDGNTAVCQSHNSQGGWGTAGSEEYFIPNRNVYIYNNIIYNPPGYQSQWQQFAIYGPVTPPEGSNAPDPATTDTNLQIRGNIIWNGPADHPLGIEDSSQGCQPDNPTCHETQLRAENHINEFEPQLVDPANGDFRPLPNGNVFSAATYLVPTLAWDDAPNPPTVPPGNPDNSVSFDFDGNPRTLPGIPGAFAAPFVASIWIYLPLVIRPL